MITRRTFVRTSALAAATFALGGVAGGLVGCSANPNVLRVGTKIDVPGFGFQNPETGNIEGMEVDIARELAKRIKGDPNALQVTGVNVTTRGAMLDNDMSTANANRDWDREKFGREESWQREKFGAEMSMKRKSADSMSDYMKMLQDDAKAQREDDKYGLGRRKERDGYDNERAGDLAKMLVDANPEMDPRVAIETANAHLARSAMNSGQQFDTEARVAGGGAIIDSFNDSLNDDGGWWSKAASGRNPFASNPIRNRNYDPSDVEVNARSWYSPHKLADAFVPGNAFSDYYAEGAQVDNGLSTYVPIADANAAAAFKRRQEEAKRARGAMPENDY